MTRRIYNVRYTHTRMYIYMYVSICINTIAFHILAFVTLHCLYSLLILYIYLLVGIYTVEPINSH